MTTLVNGDASPWSVAITCNRGCGAVLTATIEAPTRAKAQSLMRGRAAAAGWFPMRVMAKPNDWCPDCHAQGRHLR